MMFGRARIELLIALLLPAPLFGSVLQLRTKVNQIPAGEKLATISHRSKKRTKSGDLSEYIKEQRKTNREARRLLTLPLEKIVARYGLSGDLTMLAARKQGLDRLNDLVEQRKLRVIGKTALFLQKNGVPLTLSLDVANALFWNRAQIWDALEKAVENLPFPKRELPAAPDVDSIIESVRAYAAAHNQFKNFRRVTESHRGIQDATPESYVLGLEAIASEYKERKKTSKMGDLRERENLRAFARSKKYQAVNLLAEGLDRSGHVDGIDWVVFARQRLSKGQPVEATLPEHSRGRTRPLLTVATKLSKLLAIGYQPVQPKVPNHYRTVEGYVAGLSELIRRYEHSLDQLERSGALGSQPDGWWRRNKFKEQVTDLLTDGFEQIGHLSSNRAKKLTEQTLRGKKLGQRSAVSQRAANDLTPLIELGTQAGILLTEPWPTVQTRDAFFAPFALLVSSYEKDPDVATLHQTLDKLEQRFRALKTMKRPIQARLSEQWMIMHDAVSLVASALEKEARNSEIELSPADAERYTKSVVLPMKVHRGATLDEMVRKLKPIASSKMMVMLTRGHESRRLFEAERISSHRKDDANPQIAAPEVSKIEIAAHFAGQSLASFKSRIGMPTDSTLEDYRQAIDLSVEALKYASQELSRAKDSSIKNYWRTRKQGLKDQVKRLLAEALLQQGKLTEVKASAMVRRHSEKKPVKELQKDDLRRFGPLFEMASEAL